MFENFSFLIWNIHGMSSYDNYKLPQFVMDTILRKDKDIVIITEFVRTSNWSAISRKLAEKYWRYTYPTSTKNKNEILILVKKGFNNMDDNMLKMLKPQQLPINVDNPNFLQISLELSHNKNLCIIGVRIRDDDHSKQFALLNTYLQSLKSTDYVICGGDFNEWKSYTQNKLQSLMLHTPYYILGSDPFPSSSKYSTISTWSVVLKNKKADTTGKALIDHVATKNISKVNLASYCWDFVNEQNGYGTLTAEDYISDILHHPDHGILAGTVTL